MELPPSRTLKMLVLWTSTQCFYYVVGILQLFCSKAILYLTGTVLYHLYFTGIWTDMRIYIFVRTVCKRYTATLEVTSSLSFTSYVSAVGLHTTVVLGVCITFRDECNICTRVCDVFQRFHKKYPTGGSYSCFNLHSDGNMQSREFRSANCAICIQFSY